MSTIYRVLLGSFIAVILTSFISCSDEENGGGSGTGIVSTWEYVQNDEYMETLQFRADGTYTLTQKEYYGSKGNWDTEIEEGTYEFDEETMTLTIHYFEDYPEGKPVTRTLTVLQLTKNVLEIDEWWEGYNRSFVFHRV